MKTIEKRLIEELQDFKGTNEEINTSEDLYDYTLAYGWDISTATREECDNAIYEVFSK